MTEAAIQLYTAIIIFLFGAVIGSFLNVCIFRLPKGEDIVKSRSHCTGCGSILKWYDLIPVLSYILLRGRCRSCGQRISPQYPLVETANAVIYVIIFGRFGMDLKTAIYCALASALIVLSVIDFRTMEIPVGINIFILLLGILGLIADINMWQEHIIGFFAVSLPLYIIYMATKGRGIGGGDIKLMAAAGLLLGWKLIALSLVTGCILGSVIHIVRMRLFHAENVLAMGPYLSAGIMLSALWGERFIAWYISCLT